MGHGEFGHVPDGEAEVFNICHLVVGQIHHLEIGQLLPKYRQINCWSHLAHVKYSLVPRLSQLHPCACVTSHYDHKTKSRVKIVALIITAIVQEEYSKIVVIAKYKKFGLTTDDISEARINCVWIRHLGIGIVTFACNSLLGFRLSRCSCRRGQDWSEQAGVAAHCVINTHWYNWRAK